MAGRKAIGINRLAGQGISKKAGTSVKDRLARAYDLLADDPSETSVDDALALQVEAVFRD